MSLRPVLLGVVLGSTLLVGGCSGEPAAGPTSDPTAPALDWRQVSLPSGLSAVTLATTGRQVVVGAYATERPNPHLLIGEDSGALEDVPLEPGSPYGFEARWFQVATHDGRIDAVGGARGGAHGNYRWSTWSGTAAGVAEQEQPFGVFGSYGAGDLVGIAYAGGSPVVLGAWQSERTGMDIATWTRSGERWSRQPSTGTPLGSTPEELVDARAITTRGEGLLLAGSVTHLSPGSVTVAPAVWTSAGASRPWTRTDLPHMGDKGPSVVQGASCSGEQCLLTGVTEGKVAVWEVTDESAGAVPGIPDVPVPDNGTVLAPVSARGDQLVVAPRGDGSVVLRRSGSGWSATPGPPGTPVSAVAHGDELWVVTTDSRETGTLHVARVA